MKKILSIFLALIVMMSVLCAMPVSAGYGLCYTKVGNNILIEAKWPGEETADLYVASYRGGQLVKAECHEIDAFVSNPLVMEEGLDYKFFVWEDNGKLTPVFKELTVNTQTPNGSGISQVDSSVKVKAEIIATPKSDPTDCIDADGNFMVKLRVTDGIDYSVREIANMLGVIISGNATYFDVKVNVGSTDADNMIGYDVIANIKKDASSGKMTLTNASFNSTNCATKTITENLDTISVYNDGHYNIIEYYANAEDRTMTEIDVISSPKIFYNGRLVSDYEITQNFGNLEELLNSCADEVTFMGFKNAPYEKIFVTDYIYKVVKSVNEAESLIKLEVGVLDLDAESRGNENFIYNIYDAEGKAMDIADIEAGDVLNIVCPLDGTTPYNIYDVDYLDIYVTNETVTGIVESYWTDSGKYVINGEEYTTAVGLTIGEEGTFYLSIDGKIVKKDTSGEISKNFALFLGAHAETSFGVNTYTFKLFTAEGEIDLEVADTLKVIDGYGNATVMKSKDNGQVAFATSMNALVGAQATKAAAEANAKARFFAFKTNADNEIIEIRQAGDSSSELIAAIDKETAHYDAEFEEFGGYAVGEDANLFVAPVVELYSGYWNVDTDKLALWDFTLLDEDDIYNSYLYTVGGSDELSAVLMTDRPSSNIEKLPLAVVQDVGTALDADKNAVTCYKVVQGGETKIVKADYDEFPSGIYGLGVGDIFQYALNSEGEIAEAVVIYDKSARDLTTYAASKMVAYDNYAFVFGVITEYSDSITLTNEVDATLAPTMSIRLKVAETEGATYAWIEEALARNNVKKITIDAIRETVRANAVYAAVAKVNKDERIEDIIVVALDPADFDDVSEINSFMNWKITY